MNRIKLNELIYVVCLLLICCACRREIYIPVEKSILHSDTLRQTRLLHDSLHFRDSVIMQIKGDTVYKEAWRMRDRIRIVKDTVMRHHVDSIVKPVITVVEQTKEVRKFNWFAPESLCMAAVIILLAICLIRLKQH